MPSTLVEVRKEEKGSTLAAIVRRALTPEGGPGISWNRARDLVSTGRVELDGEIATDEAQRLEPGAKVAIHPERPKRTGGVLAAEDVVYVDADVVVVKKRAGVMTVPFDDGDRDTLIDQVRARLVRLEKAKNKKPRDLVVGAVQRLDKDTTGILVFARNLSAKRILEEQLREHSVFRRYLGIAHGTVREARIESWILQDRGDGLRGSWGTRFGQEGPPPEDAKQSITHVRPLEPLVNATLIECRLETGRQHQIRIHLSERGHPLVGEDVYIRGFKGTRIEAARPMLHATELGFVHPRTGENMRFSEPPPADFAKMQASLRLEKPFKSGRR
jgi:23S rRNA pseudouridine1911/1915/1917 synthase